MSDILDLTPIRLVKDTRNACGDTFLFKTGTDCYLVTVTSAYLLGWNEPHYPMPVLRGLGEVRPCQ